MAGAKQWSVSANWIVPVDGPPITNGVMRGRGKTIEAVGTPSEVPHTQDHRTFGNAVVMPGLINAHAHLDQTHLAGQLPPNRPYIDWFERVRGGQVGGKEQDESVAAGIAKALATGTTTIVDASGNHRAIRILKNSPIRKICMAEVHDLDDSSITLETVARKVKGTHADLTRRLGLLIHSSWSASPALYAKAIALANQRKWVIATHLSETEAERQFLLHRLGPLVEFRSRLGAAEFPEDSFRGTPVAYAKHLGLLDAPTLLVHASSIDDDDIELLGAGQATVVCCPRAQKFLARGAHRYADMLAAGCNVCLGTETMAANFNLDMIEEMRQLRFDGKIDVGGILRTATENAAKALGMADKIGTLTAGKQADWVAVELGPNAGHPIESILTLGGRVLETVIAGQTVYKAPEGGEKK